MNMHSSIEWGAANICPWCHNLNDPDGSINSVHSACVPSDEGDTVTFRRGVGAGAVRVEVEIPVMECTDCGNVWFLARALKVIEDVANVYTRRVNESKGVMK